MIKVLELFAGIGACSKALERLGIEHEIVDAVEIDKYAIKSFNAIHGTNFETQDITQWDKDIECDLIMHGSPCQDFSLAGKQAGGDIGSGTRSSLMYETIRIVGKLRPKYVIWENVKNVLSAKHKHNFDNYLTAMSSLGYTNYYQVLNAKDYGIPQNRERVFTVSILKDYVVYDDYNSSIRKDQETIGTLTTNCGSSTNRNGWKIIEHTQAFEFPNGEENENTIQRLFNFSARHDCRVVYDAEGIAPTLVAGMGEGGGKVPMVIENFEFPPKQELKLRLKDMLEPEVDRKYYLSNTGVEYFQNQALKRNEDLTKCREEKLITVAHGQCKGSIRDLDISPTLDTQFSTNWRGVLLEPKCVQVGTLDIKGMDCIKRVYSDEGLSPTLTDMQGGNRQPKVLIKNATKKGYQEAYEGDSVNLAYPVIYDDRDKGFGVKITDICPTQRAMRNGIKCIYPDLRIRKLTPKECWRLMGFDDADIDKCIEIGMSNTQLYKQAGNSIVVNVLEAIFKNLIK
jgi:DNA (cytosine-5)-methyltransferase 1